MFSSFATAASKSGVFQKKTFKQVWTGDKGAWPVMATFVLTFMLVPTFGGYYLIYSPDVKLFGNTRREFLRGELAAAYRVDR